MAKKQVVKKSSDKSSGKRGRVENLKPFKKGQSGNPKGYKKGQRNFKTIYRDALIKLAALNEITPEDLEDDMIKMAIKKAREGDAVFYKDVMDRIHGKAVQPHSGADGEGPIEYTVHYLPKRK